MKFLLKLRSNYKSSRALVTRASPLAEMNKKKLEIAKRTEFNRLQNC